MLRKHEKPLLWHTFLCPLRSYNYEGQTNWVFLLKDVRDSLLQSMPGLQNDSLHIDFYKGEGVQGSNHEVVIDKVHTEYHILDLPLPDDAFIPLRWFLLIKIVNVQKRGVNSGLKSGDVVIPVSRLPDRP